MSHPYSALNNRISDVASHNNPEISSQTPFIIPQCPNSPAQQHSLIHPENTRSNNHPPNLVSIPTNFLLPNAQNSHMNSSISKPDKHKSSSKNKNKNKNISSELPIQITNDEIALRLSTIVKNSSGMNDPQSVIGIQYFFIFIADTLCRKGNVYAISTKFCHWKILSNAQNAKVYSIFHV